MTIIPLIFFWIVASAQGAEPTSAVMPSTALAVTLELPSHKESVAPTMERKEQTLSVDFANAPVNNIIRSVADLYELNVVIPESLSGNASIKLHKVTWQQVFKELLEPRGFSYNIDDNIIRIRGKSESDQEPMRSEVFIVNYANLTDIKNALTPFVDMKAGGKLQTDNRSNALIITEKPAQIREIQRIVEQLDQPTPQVMIASKFVEIGDNDTKNLGVNWQSLSGYRLSASGGLQNSSDQGTSSGNTGTPTGSISRIIGKTSTYEVLADGTKNPAGTAFSRLDSVVLSADQFNVVLSALNTQTGTKVVSNPTIVTLNNVPANVAIAQQYPLPQYSYNDQTGTFEVSGFDYKDIGITMKVTPQVNKAGFITLNVKPELSTQNGTVNIFNSAGTNPVQIPIINSRTTESIVTLKDGYTLAIGGLSDQQKTDTVTKVPLLGSLPLIGLLFSSKSKQLVQRNLVIFITAKTLDAGGATYKDVLDPRVIHDMKITPSEIPGYKLPDASLAHLDQVAQQRNQVQELDFQNRLENEANVRKKGQAGS
jgi:type IV pilus assembly protein PilQ